MDTSGECSVLASPENKMDKFKMLIIINNRNLKIMQNDLNLQLIMNNLILKKI